MPTPASVAALLTLLMQDRLVDRDASAEMRGLLAESAGALVPLSRSSQGLRKLPEEGTMTLPCFRAVGFQLRGDS